jgi:hypothetical protein
LAKEIPGGTISPLVLSWHSGPCSYDLGVALAFSITARRADSWDLVVITPYRMQHFRNMTDFLLLQLLISNYTRRQNH